MKTDVFRSALILKRRFRFSFGFPHQWLVRAVLKNYVVHSEASHSTYTVVSVLGAKRQVPQHFENFPDLNACMYLYI